MNLSKVKLLAFVAAGILCCKATFSQERVISVVGEYAFGPQMSQEQACINAEVRAKEDALRRVFGETHFSHRLIECISADSQSCEYQRVSTSTLNGALLGFSDRRQVLRDDLGLRVCEVTGKVHLDTGWASNKDLYFDVRLNRHLYRVGDEVTIDIQAPGKSFVAIFSQSDTAGGQITRVFPNRHRRNTGVTDKLSLPGDDRSYRLSVAKGLPDKKVVSRVNAAIYSEINTTAVVEYLYVIRTTGSVNWLESYSIDELLRHLSQIDRGTRVIRVIPYRVIH